jgi:hypothetical protein
MKLGSNRTFRGGGGSTALTGRNTAGQASGDPSFSSSCAWCVLRQGESGSSLPPISAALSWREHDLAMASFSHGEHVSRCAAFGVHWPLVSKTVSG